MKAISIRREFAAQIVQGLKRIENRTWRVAYRGRIAIHASGPNGAILGTVELADIVDAAEALRLFPEQGKYITGPWCWVLKNPQQFSKSIPFKGRLGLWNYERSDP